VVFDFQSNQAEALFKITIRNTLLLYQKGEKLDPSKPVAGRKIKVLFKNGELMAGTTNGYYL